MGMPSWSDAGAFDALGDSDWLEAFAGHPRIGERGDDTGQSGTERHCRCGDVGARAVGRGEQEYEATYGFTYIVYASGKTAEEMLDIAREPTRQRRARKSW